MARELLFSEDRAKNFFQRSIIMRKIWNKIFGKKKPVYAVISEYINNDDYETKLCLEPKIVCITTDKEKALEEAKWECEHRTADIMGCWWHLDQMEMHENEGLFAYHYEISDKIIVGTIIVEVEDYSIL